MSITFVSVVVIVVCLAVAFVARDKPKPLPTTTAASNELSIVAGPEQEPVFNQIVRPWCEQRQINCKLTTMGTVDQARLLQDDTSKLTYDAFWFASDTARQQSDRHELLEDVEPVTATPIVYAGRKAVMDDLGFTGREVTLDDILQTVEAKNTSVWAANPSQSSDGAAVLFWFMNHFAENDLDDAVSAKQLDSQSVKDGITRFTRSFDRTPPSTDALMRECIASSTCQTLFTEESQVIKYNKQLVTEGKEPFTVVYPKGGVATTESTLGYVPRGNDVTHDNFEALQEYLRSAEAQRALAEQGYRPLTVNIFVHPIIWWDLYDVPVPPETFKEEWGVKPELEEQSTLEAPEEPVVEEALDNYQTEYRRPADTYYCLDGSGSMGGNNGWVELQRASGMLFDPVEAKKYQLQLHPQDVTTVDIFNDGLLVPPTRVDGNNPTRLNDLNTMIQALKPGGNTAIYSCMERAAVHFKAMPNDGKKRMVIVMTDGRNTAGITNMDQISTLEIPVNTVAFSNEADKGALQAISARTQGAFREAVNLPVTLREVTGYR